MEKQSFFEAWSKTYRKVHEAQQKQRRFEIRHRITGVLLLVVDVTPAGKVNLEGANLADADLRRRGESLLVSLHSILPLLFAILPFHLPEGAKECLLFLAIGLMIYAKSRGHGQPQAQINLFGANLRNAILIGADLCGAILDGADLRGANLFAAQIRGASFKRVLFDETTTWPAGFRPPRRKRCNYDPPTPGI